MLEQKLLEEVKRFNQINKYGKTMIMEQDVPPAPNAPAGDSPLAAPAGDVPTPPVGDTPADAPASPDAATLTDSTPDSTEEVDVTDLVDMTKSIKKDIEDNKNDHGAVLSKMDDVFTKLNDLEVKLGEMNQIVSKIDELGFKVEQMKPQTPQEKLEMRSLDSYPFNEKPQEFFAHKMGEMKASGKNEYILTKNEVENYPTDEIRKSFNPQEEEEDEIKF